MEKKFEKVAVNEANSNYEKLIARQKDMYGRSDDVRSPFVRDYTRVIHSLAYRRLKHKTQVFYNGAKNDHICTRIEHVLHVDSVSNTIAHYLGLNEELTRAIAIAHDLGHAPFGHQGEKIINDLSEKYLKKKFWHEKNGVYFVDKIELLEDNQMQLRNLNLTYAVRDGIISHCGEIQDDKIFPREELFPLEKFKEAAQFQAATWEGCVVKFADTIAYLGRDIEDAIRLFYLSSENKKVLLDMAQKSKKDAINTTVIMHSMIIDLCNNSSPENGLLLSKEMNDQLRDLKDFNYKNIYYNERLKIFGRYAELVIKEIFFSLEKYYNSKDEGENIIHYLKKIKYDNRKFVKGFSDFMVQYCNLDLSSMPEENEIASRCVNEKIYGDLSEEKYLQAIIDFIAGMTDSYAIESYNELLCC